MFDDVLWSMAREEPKAMTMPEHDVKNLFNFFLSRRQKRNTIPIQPKSQTQKHPLTNETTVKTTSQTHATPKSTQKINYPMISISFCSREVVEFMFYRHHKGLALLSDTAHSHWNTTRTFSRLECTTIQKCFSLFLGSKTKNYDLS